MSRGLIVKPALNQKRVILLCRCEWKLNNHGLTRVPSRGECRMRSMYCDERSYTYRPKLFISMPCLFCCAIYIFQRRQSLCAIKSVRSKSARLAYVDACLVCFTWFYRYSIRQNTHLTDKQIRICDAKIVLRRKLICAVCITFDRRRWASLFFYRAVLG